MAIPIPADFDVKAQLLDVNESLIRDQLGLRVDNWVKFRHTISAGVGDNLRSRGAGAVSPEVAEAYIELGKSHYEVVTSLGSARLLLDTSLQAGNNDLLVRTLSKAFYFHIGCLLDNLGRLVYIVNDTNSATATYARGQRSGQYIRHWIDWGAVPDYSGYSRLKKSVALCEIRNIRNVFTHGWRCPYAIHEATGLYCWPIAIRTKRDFYWPYDEEAVMRRTYRRFKPVNVMMQEDFGFIEAFQDKVFGKLVRDITRFERNYGVVIR